MWGMYVGDYEFELRHAVQDDCEICQERDLTGSWSWGSGGLEDRNGHG